MPKPLKTPVPTTDDVERLKASIARLLEEREELMARVAKVPAPPAPVPANAALQARVAELEAWINNAVNTATINYASAAKVLKK